MNKRVDLDIAFIKSPHVHIRESETGDSGAFLLKKLLNFTWKRCKFTCGLILSA